jgi:hypothetical protein
MYPDANQCCYYFAGGGEKAFEEMKDRDSDKFGKND